MNRQGPQSETFAFGSSTPRPFGRPVQRVAVQLRSHMGDTGNNFARNSGPSTVAPQQGSAAGSEGFTSLPLPFAMEGMAMEGMAISGRQCG